MTIYGYCRVSSADQNEDKQLFAMSELNIPAERIYTDKVCGEVLRTEAIPVLVTDADTHLLLSHISEIGSLKHAAARMGVSQSKAIKMVAVAEEQLGYQLLATSRGGPGGGRSALTKEASELMARYEAFRADFTEHIIAAVDRHFGDMGQAAND